MAGCPLITLAMVTYNHEKYILEALKGAVAQTYSPLEIIVSDDASTDKTAEIINEFVGQYTGPHTWRININETNLGVLGNCMRVAGLAQGELIVYSDGDDVSLPGRVKACSQYYQQHPDHDYFICKAEWMDEHGHTIPSDFGHPESRPGVIWNICHRVPGAWGTCSCHHRRLYDVFGIMRIPDLKNIDGALAFRAILLGGRVNFLDGVFVRYRQHSGGVVSARSSTSGICLSKKYIKVTNDLIYLMQQMACDVKKACELHLISEHLCTHALRAINNEIFGSRLAADALTVAIPFRALQWVRYLLASVFAACRNAYQIKSCFLLRK